MALKKEIELDNGVALNYHRITTLTKTTNISNTIEVSSYTSAKQRQKEKEYQELQIKNANLEEGESLTEEEQELLNKGINVYIQSNYFTLPYDENQTIEQAYEYLKTTEIFEGAEDVIEKE